MGQNDLSLGKSDKFYRMLVKGGQDESLWIGHVDVFAGTDDDAVCNKSNVFARIGIELNF